MIAAQGVIRLAIIRRMTMALGNRSVSGRRAEHWSSFLGGNDLLFCALNITVLFFFFTVLSSSNVRGTNYINTMATLHIVRIVMKMIYTHSNCLTGVPEYVAGETDVRRYQLEHGG